MNFQSSLHSFCFLILYLFAVFKAISSDTVYSHDSPISEGLDYAKLRGELSPNLEASLTRLDNCVEQSRLKIQKSLRPSKCIRCHAISDAKYAGVKLNYYEHAIKRYCSKFKCETFCEVGFNRGDSATAWLEFAPDANLLSFTMDTRWYTKPGISCTKMAYLERVEIIIGDSRKTVPDYFQEHPDKRCDIIHIDGGKGIVNRKEDMKNFRNASKSDALWLLDDVALTCKDPVYPPPEKIHSCNKWASVYDTTHSTEHKSQIHSYSAIYDMYTRFARENGLVLDCVLIPEFLSHNVNEGACTIAKSNIL